MTLLPLLTLLCATPASEQGWTASFPASALTRQLDVRPVAVLVAAANPQARPAAGAIETALRGSGEAQLVMDDAALGDLEGLGDLQIVERSRGLPVDRVLVVRVFPRADGPSSAVIALYDLAGNRKAAFAAEEGQPLQDKAALGAPPPAPPEPERKSAQERYEERYIGFSDVQLFDSATGRAIEQWMEPYQGKYRQRLETRDFLELVGRTDLIATYEKRNRVRLSIALGGAGLLVGGGGLITWGLVGACMKVDVANDQCLARDGRPVIAGSVVSGVGLAALLAASIIDPNPVDGPTARKIADTYNKQLRRELGLQEAGWLQAPPPTTVAGAGIAFEF